MSNRDEFAAFLEEKVGPCDPWDPGQLRPNRPLMIRKTGHKGAHIWAYFNEDWGSFGNWSTGESWGWKKKTYLERKGIDVDEATLNLLKAKKDKDNVYITMRNKEGEVTGTQVITETDGEKRFVKGSVLKGSFTELEGDINPTFLCEGWATGVSINKATGKRTIVAFSCSNLVNVAPLFPEAIVVADNDEAGIRGAKETGLETIVIPIEGMDANDYALSFGLDMLRDVLTPSPFYIKADEEILKAKGYEMLVKDLFPSEGVAILFGNSGSGKSFLALDLAAHIASGLDRWFDRPIQNGVVLWHTKEGLLGNRLRLKALKEHKGLSLENLYINTDPIGFDEEGFRRIKRHVDNFNNGRVRLIVFDTLSLYQDGDENATPDARVFMDKIGQLTRSRHTLVLLIHHTGVGIDNQFRSRGSSVFRAQADTEIRIDKNGNGGLCTVTKQKDMKIIEPFSFVLKEVLFSDINNASSAVVEQVEEFTKTEINDSGRVKEFGDLIKTFESFLNSPTAVFNVEGRLKKKLLLSGLVAIDGDNISLKPSEMATAWILCKHLKKEGF